MPRIPVRTTPYHSLPRCTRHYKSKRELALKALSKASFINGNQFVIAWISPKGEVDVFASELLQDAIKAPEGAGGVLNRKELEREAARVKGVLAQRWDEYRRREERGDAVTMAMDDDDEKDDDDGADDDFDADRTLVDDGSLGRPGSSTSGQGATPPKALGAAPASKGGSLMTTFATQQTRASTPAPPMHTLTLAPAAVDQYYMDRFAALQQTACKTVVKAWIKVIEPKKQAKYPYNRGEDARPAWWPEGVKHREPDHLGKSERMTLLTAIIRSPLTTANRLQIATAEVGTQISAARQAILRELYLVATEEERMRKESVSGDLVVHLEQLPLSPSAVSPEMTEKRPAAAMYDDKENSYAFAAAPPAKRGKMQPRLPALTTASHAAYDNNFSPVSSANSPFTFAPQNAAHMHAPHGHSHLSPWRELPPSIAVSGAAYHGGHLTPELAWDAERFAPHGHHLAPLMSAHGSGAPSPLDSPALSHSAHMGHVGSHQGSAGAGTPGVGPGGHPHTAGSYFAARQPSHMQQQQMDYLQQHHELGAAGYNYGAPYLADAGWDTSFAQST